MMQQKSPLPCPTNVAPSGVESLHQLGYHLINDLINAFMFYYNFDNKRFETSLYPEYELYNAPYVLKIQKEEDIRKNILVVSEIYNALSLLTQFKNIRKGV